MLSLTRPMNGEDGDHTYWRYFDSIPTPFTLVIKIAKLQRFMHIFAGFALPSGHDHYWFLLLLATHNCFRTGLAVDFVPS